MILLIKFPTRQRPEKFFSVLDKYYDYLDDLDNAKFVISCDVDDDTMNNENVKRRLSRYRNLKYYYGNNKSKVEAINNDMTEDKNWDVCLLASDDMIPQIKGYDSIIKTEMEKKYKDFDGVLWFFDGIQKDLNTLCILGKKYYDRFNYIYNPSYTSLWCDNEFHAVANLLNKHTFINQCIIKHEHPVWGYGQVDELQKRNDTYYQDKAIFDKRVQISFSIFDYTDDIVVKKEIESQNPFHLSGSLNKYDIDEVYVINLERRKDRLEHITAEMNRFGIQFNRFDAIDGKTVGVSGAVACLRSHIGVIKDAIKKGHNTIAVFEDDVILCDDFLERLNYYISNVPNDWEILYLGCGYMFGAKKTLVVSPYIYNIKQCFGCFSMILNNKNGLFQRIIEKTKDEKKPIDDYMAFDILPYSRGYVFDPFFVKTLNTISDISGREDSYSYTGIDSSFKEVIDIPQNKQKRPPPPPIMKQEVFPPKTNKQLCDEYMNSSGNFKIFVANRAIFDSKVSPKSNVVFYEDCFTLYGKKFTYNGVFIKGYDEK